MSRRHCRPLGVDLCINELTSHHRDADGLMDNEWEINQECVICSDVTSKANDSNATNYAKLCEF